MWPAVEKIVLLAAALCLATLSVGQGIVLLPGNETTPILDRLEIKTGILPPFHPAAQYITRGDAVKYALLLDTVALALSAKDQWDLGFVFKDNKEWLPADSQFGLISDSLAPKRHRLLYPTPARMVEVNVPDFFFIR